MLLCGNKSDLKEKRAITLEDSQVLGESKSLKVIETSAKDAFNVDEAFMQIATDALKTK